jgi:hypothetical protein
MPGIIFDETKYRALRKAYNEAVLAGKTEFVFEGHDLLTSYAYYMLEHVANTLGITEKRKR